MISVNSRINIARVEGINRSCKRLSLILVEGLIIGEIKHSHICLSHRKTCSRYRFNFLSPTERNVLLNDCESSPICCCCFCSRKIFLAN
jgi:hypothetical protein